IYASRANISPILDDIALSLAALGIRIIAPIPGKGTIGIEVPNKEPQMVPIRSIISSRKFQECNYELPMAMGSTISKDVFIADLTKMPHVLVAGATGQGKSVGLNTIIASLLYKKHPAELKFVLVDPKMVEFSLYSKLERHYLAKLPDENEAIITDPMKVVATLNSLCVEMDNRYALLKDANVRTIKEYNNKFIQRRLNPEKGHRYLPYIVIVVDEFGDLIMMAGKEVETPIARIAQKARAVGMHMILATQRPSTNVITGIIKANFPGRIAFRVSQMVDSRTILDRTGANQLIGKGDMLFSHNGEMERVQCAFISTEEVEAICDAIDEQVGYPNAYPLPDYVPESDGSTSFGTVNDRDPLFEEAARFIVTSSTASTSSLQRRYSIGYNRAGKIMDQLEAAGIVGPASGAKPRQVLVDSLQLERMLEITA
uniref:DNA translocase FtsK n=1 Tax=uncultured Muribaculum sp. TaxID=1918613 RepID=UPI0025B6E08D